MLSLGTLTSAAPAVPSPGCPGVPGRGVQPATAPTLAASAPAAVLTSVLVAPTSPLAPEPWRGAGGGQAGSSLSAGTWVMAGRAWDKPSKAISVSLSPLSS